MVDARFMPALHQDLVTTLLDYEILTPVVGFWSQLHLAVLKEVEDLLAQLLELPTSHIVHVHWNEAGRAILRGHR